MREYLVEFFKDFAYEEADARHLLKAYDHIEESQEAKALLAEILLAYSANISLDYKEEVQGKARKIAEITALHPFTVDLVVFLCMTKHLRKVYEENGISLQIYRDSVLDLKWKLEECKIVKGICGSFVAHWFAGFFNLTRFCLGRLQFELRPIPFDYEKNGRKFIKDESLVIKVHIPRTGAPMDKESCDKAYAQAREFFRDKVGENPAFLCDSWLLYPENKKILSPQSNTYRFLLEYDVVSWRTNTGEDLWRLFDTDEKNPARLPTDTSFRARYVEHLKKGGRVGLGIGIKL
ncbi:MAG: DUF5596 domain-containing protein [Oscillospiraceae bacterium]|nr:DUF5596 domain-containing protein [Oscillospiraceae bacterium]